MTQPGCTKPVMISKLNRENHEMNGSSHHVKTSNVEQVTISPAQAQRNLQASRKRGKMVVIMGEMLHQVQPDRAISEWIRWASEQADAE